MTLAIPGPRTPARGVPYRELAARLRTEPFGLTPVLDARPVPGDGPNPLFEVASEPPHPLCGGCGHHTQPGGLVVMDWRCQHGCSCYPMCLPSTQEENQLV